uniref:Uncharacterized protein n=1 Tax=Magallana gigas TaxID=29159 RepID=K1RQI8_MAGGI
MAPPHVSAIFIPRIEALISRGTTCWHHKRRTGPGFLQSLPAIWKVDSGDLPGISILQTSKSGLLLQFSNRPNEYTLE